jgi:pyridoxamine 5'-phosphate oxidase
MTDPRDMRAPSGSHDDRPLDREDLDDDPAAQFRRWLADAETAGIVLPHAMAVATADERGHPSVRFVLLRGADERGFTFFTNYESRKSREIAANPWAGLVFFWKELDRQVRVDGPVERLDARESDEYFATRPRDAQLGAWASDQSTVLVDRGALEERMSWFSERFPGEVERPPHWGGFRIRAHTIEFWQGRAHRLHDRFRYVRSQDGSSGWSVDRLSP